MKQENHETRSLSRVFNVCKPCLRMNVRFFYESIILIAVVVKKLGGKRTINSARDEKSKVSVRTSFRKPWKKMLFTINVEI